MLLLIYCLMYSPLFVEVLCLCLFCFYVPSSFAIILKRKRKLVAMLLSSYRYVVAINFMWLTMPWTGLQYVIVVFPDHIHLFFVIKPTGTFSSI